MRRIACLRIPHPQLAFASRRHPEWQGRPVILGSQPQLLTAGPSDTGERGAPGVDPQQAPSPRPHPEGNGRGLVLAVSRAARDAGVEPGMTLTQAKTILPQAHFITEGPVAEKQEWERIAVLLGRFSPLVEMADEPGVFYLDAHGMGRLYPTEREYLSHIRFTLQGEGYQPRAGLAGNKFAARAATFLGDITTLPPKRESHALAALPVTLLPLSQVLLDALDSLGVHTLGALGQLPTGQLEARFGKEGLIAARLAHGEDPTPLRAYQPPNLTAVDLELDGPVEGLEPVRFILKTVTDRLIGELAQRGLACEEARLYLRLDTRTTAVLGVVPAAPTLSAPLLWELARNRLEREPLTAPIVSVRMEAVRVSAPEPDQTPLFTRSGDHERAQLAVARLRGILGDEAVLVPKRSAAYRPERRIAWLAYHEAEPVRKKKMAPVAKAPPKPNARHLGFYKPKAYASALLPFPSQCVPERRGGLSGPKAHGSGVA